MLLCVLQQLYIIDSLYMYIRCIFVLTNSWGALNDSIAHRQAPDCSDALVDGVKALLETVVRECRDTELAALIASPRPRGPIGL
jgi:hypothetical protein